MTQLDAAKPAVLVTAAKLAPEAVSILDAAGYAPGASSLRLRPTPKLGRLSRLWRAIPGVVSFSNPQAGAAKPQET